MSQTIQQAVNQDFVKAMKDKDRVRIETLKMLRAAIGDHEIEEGVGARHGTELANEKVEAVLRSEVKKRKDSIALYKKGNRQDLVDRESQELAIVEQYLPKMLDEHELEKVVERVLSGTDQPEFGVVMGKVMGELRGKADGDVVRSMVLKRLQALKEAS